MRKLFILLLLTMSLVHADDIRTTDGKIYKDATVVSHDAVSATILYEDGGATIPIIKLPHDLQVKLGYDPAAAANQIAVEKKEQIQAAVQKVLRETAIPTQGQIVQVLPDGILADLVDLRPEKDFGMAGMTEHQSLAPGMVFVSCPTSGLIDNADWSGTVWRIGSYAYETTAGAQATVEKFTTSPDEAAKAILSTAATAAQ